MLGDVWGPNNSQHLLDPYSFTHLLHGFVLGGLLAWMVPRLPAAWLLFAVIEVALLVWIRDSLLLNVLTLLYPNTPVRGWQLGR